MKKSKKWIAMFLASALVFTTLIGSAFAADVADVYEDNAPESVKTNMGTETILSGATAAANTTELNFLGINVTSTDSAGALNAMSDATAPLDLLVFGSDLNTNPDPYLYNFYYNLADNGFVLPAEEYDMAAYSSWVGDYTLLNAAKNGPSGGATKDNRRDILVNTAYKYCDPVFFYEPDVLFGAAKDSYDYGLYFYNLGKTTPYSPLVIDGWTTNGKATNEPYLESTFTMANAVYEDAVAIQEALPNLQSRYNGGNIVQCGRDYSDFALGLYYFLQSRLNPIVTQVSKISKSTYCTGISITDDGKITVTNSYEEQFQNNRRYMQYIDGIADYVEADPDKVYNSYGDFKKDVDLVIMDPDDLEPLRIERLSGVGVKIVDIDAVMPQTVYGTTMQSADNILGMPWFIGLLYEKRLSSYNYGLSEYDYLAYFVKNIYHVKDEDVETVVKEMLREGGGDVYKTFEERGLTDNYEYYIDSMIEIGTWYYTQTELGSGNWKSVDDLYANADSGD